MFLITLCFLSLTIHLFLRYIYSYWKRNDFPFLEPKIPFGNLNTVAKGKRSFGISIYDLYLKTKEPFIGVYLLFRPALLIRDPVLVKKILVEDFSSFHDRGIYCNEKRDPMSASLFALRGERWKSMRTKMTSSFSSGKLKGMFSTILDVGKELDKYLLPFAEKNEIVDVKDNFQRYTIMVIASVIFGLDVNTIQKPDHEFCKIAKRLNKPPFLQSLKLASSFLCPELLEFLRVNWLTETVQKFMIKIVENAIEHREKNNVTRKDFMQLLLQLRNTGELNKDDDNWNFVTTTSTKKILSVEQLAAQVFIFYIAGFDSSSSTMSFCLYEIAQNPEIMKKLQNEIDETLKQHNNEITYDAIQEMKYLECCISETLRKYPILSILNRECTKEYEIPDSPYTIKKGMGVVISLYGIHHDSQYYPNPEEFDPERYNEKNKSFNSRYYFPFGDGPRNCIGIRLGKLIVKIGLIVMLMKYNFEPLDNNKLEYDEKSVLLIAKGGINLKISKKNIN